MQGRCEERMRGGSGWKVGKNWKSIEIGDGQTGGKSELL